MINNKKMLNIINKLKYQDLIKNLLSVKVYTNIKNNNYSLKRNINFRNKKISIPLIMKNSKITNENDTECNIQAYINNFNQVLLNNFKEDSLLIYLNNLVNLRVGSSKFTFLKLLWNSEIMAIYFVDKNKLVIRKGNKKESTIYHELFHVASSIIDGNTYFIGFSQYTSKKGMIGKGLNEGYTELLTNRYFNSNDKSYQFEMKCAYLLEQIVGKQQMENLYLKADLFNLKNTISEYTTEENFTTFLTNLDIINDTTYSSLYYYYYKEDTLNRYRDILIFLVETYSKKLYLSYINSEINELDKDKLLSDYISNIPKQINLEEITYNIITTEELNNIANKKFYSFLEKKQK